jgi:tRNA ligase
VGPQDCSQHRSNRRATRSYTLGKQLDSCCRGPFVSFPTHHISSLTSPFVLQLCDDSFEEHVLPYSKDSTGLHLHGLNENIREFKTMLPDVVEQFSKDWGFIVTKSIVLHSIPEVKKFTDEINAAKEWNGEALEGFVVRTHISEPPTKGNMDASRSPYAPGSSFFFKVKFDEPYMMYRDWRELTKACLAQAEKKGANHIDISALAKKRMQRPETKVYVNWVVSEIKRDVRQFDGYNANHGIIATRERFLKWLEENKGKTEARSVPSVAGTSTSTSNTVVEKTFGKTIIVPVAIPGCGSCSTSYTKDTQTDVYCRQDYGLGGFAAPFQVGTYPER